MGLVVKEQGGGFELVPEDQYQAVCYAVVDLGTQDEEYQNKARQVHKVWIAHELPELRIDMEDENGDKVDRPQVISQFYTLSLNEKAKLRAHLRSWRGREFTPEELDGFELFNILGVNSMIQVIHVDKRDGGKRAVIDSITKLPRGMTVLKPELPLVRYSIAENGVDVPDSVPEGIKKIIMASAEHEYIRRAGEKLASFQQPANDDPNEDDLPF